jgi:putative transcriptional regulator
LYANAIKERCRDVIRFRLKERIADRSFKTGRKVTLDEVAAGTGIHRATLSKIGTKKGYNASTDVLDRLCTFFACRIEELVEHVPGESAGAGEP